MLHKRWRKVCSDIDIYPDEWTNYYCEYNHFIFEDGKLIAIIPWFDISDGNLKENRLIFEK